MINKIKILLLIILSTHLFSYNHPEIDWLTYETEHFIIHYHESTSRSAKEASLVAEEVYDSITKLYNFYPKTKTTIIVRDTDDISNGAAYYFDNKIVISSLPLNFDLRGSHRWLQNVITHEFTHIIQIGASMKYSQSFPMLFMQGIGYEDEKRTDVLYGYPNTIISYPIPNVSMPPWFAEGTAQHMGFYTYDFWDSHRDMILRDKTLNMKLLSLNQMNTFGKSGAGQEFVYTQGFSLTEYISQQYGDSTLYALTNEFSKKNIYSINKVFNNVLRRDANSVYNDWKNSLIEIYNIRTKNVSENLYEGEILVDQGITNLYPVFSPSGDKFAFLSNMDNDYFGQTDLYIYSFKDSLYTKIASGVKMAPCWYGDSTILYTKRSKPSKTGSRFYDFYKYSIALEDEERLTFGERVFSPSIDAHGRVFGVRYNDGTANIVTGHIDSLSLTEITDFDNGRQIYSTHIDDSILHFDFTDNHHRDIHTLDIIDIDSAPEHYKSEAPSTNGAQLLNNPLMVNEWDSRSPKKSNDKLVFSDDRTGIFNIYLESDESSGFVTNVIGGAFTPSISKDGRILYSIYKDGGYRIAILNNPKIVDIDNVGYEDNYYKNWVAPDMIVSDKSINDYYKYKEGFGSLAILPRVMIEYGTIKPGLYLLNSDPLDKFNFLGQISINRNKDLDIAFLIELKRYYLTYYSNLFWVTRHVNKQYNYTSSSGYEFDNMPITNNLTFMIFSSDIGTRFKAGPFKFNLQYSFTQYRQHVLYNMNQNYTYNSENLSNNVSGDLAFDYYRSNQIAIGIEFNKYKPTYLWNMVPSNGYGMNTIVSYENNKFLSGFGVDEEYGTFGANLSPHNTFRINSEAYYNFSFGSIAFNSLIKYKSISNKDVDDFFYIFGGGNPGLKGYTYYDEELSVTDFLVVENFIRTFVFKEKSFQLSHIQLQAISIGIAHQFGVDYSMLTSGDFLGSIGIEFRALSYSFFSYPTALQYEYYIPYMEQDSIDNGKHYLSILFDF